MSGLVPAAHAKRGGHVAHSSTRVSSVVFPMVPGGHGCEKEEFEPGGQKKPTLQAPETADKPVVLQKYPAVQIVAAALASGQYVPVAQGY